MNTTFKVISRFSVQKQDIFVDHTAVGFRTGLIFLTQALSVSVDFMTKDPSCFEFLSSILFVDFETRFSHAILPDSGLKPAQLACFL